MDRSPVGRISDGVASAWLHSARPSRAGREWATSDPDEATKRTVEVMCQQIASSCRAPIVQQTALRSVQQFHGGPFYKGTDALHDPQAIAVSCWFWAKHNIAFEHHEELFRSWLPEDAGQLQLLIAPDVLVRMERKRGDCAIFTELICAFLKCLGVPFEIVPAAVNPDEPGIFSHVYPRAVLSNGSRLALDASHGPYPGWKVPTAHTFRQKVWNEDGIEVPDMAYQFQGLHAYRPRKRRGFGDTTTLEDGTVIDLLESCRTVELEGETCIVWSWRDVTAMHGVQRALKVFRSRNVFTSHTRNSTS